MDRHIAEDDAALFAAARVARDFAQLPGAPRPDWCQRAARAMAEAVPGSRASIAVARRLARGRAGIERTGDSGPIAGADDVDAPRVRALAKGVLSRLGQPVRPGVHALAELALGADTPGDAAGYPPESETVVGVSPVAQSGDDGRGLVLLAFWGQPPAAIPATLSTKDLRRILRSAMPVLSDRLRLALRGGGEQAVWLSDREQRVLELLTSGLSVPEIAELLGRSQHTVHDYVKSLHRKLGTNTRGGLVARALGYCAEGVGFQHAAHPGVHAAPMLAFRTGGRTAFVDHSLC